MIREWKDETIKRFLKEGRGQGEGSVYKPWLQVQDISSRGRSTRIFSNTSKRVIHILSDLQLYYYNLLEFDTGVVDIQENYPLLNLHDFDIPMDQELTKKLYNPKTKVPHILTVSFLITRIDRNNKPYHVARVIKASTELEKKSTIERLELQRRYFEKKNIDFGIVTEKEINKQVARNVGWALTAYDLQDYPQLVSNLAYLKADMLKLLSNPTEILLNVFGKIENSYQLEEGMAMVLFKHLVATKQLVMDLDKKIETSKNVKFYNLQVSKSILAGDNRAVGS
jgi:hypothetical protein